MSSKSGKPRKSSWDRNTQEQIRKRRHNLFKRIKEFHDRYGIETWCTMRMPSGRLYVFNTNPDEPSPPTGETEHEVTIIHKTPADYAPKQPSVSPVKAPPALPFHDLPCFVHAALETVHDIHAPHVLSLPPSWAFVC
ncbi:hypothetical protein BDQ94DRAFT_176358 [Aspergillus welwitschiae]|uniref:MADS-box domain-containing protein n=1 Tax=Aspergillus welwitschiae TaxID=1341132 RepID=A0A3F3PHU5_9EURO|nr:hypothetical protein BDQ94DRAFT_176358 [Aspergillus welwitschiae]RDH26468.1 hypothetical protein BDQ94DRAFT_176358 [Aspergillus welwitschiae]